MGRVAPPRVRLRQAGTITEKQTKRSASRREKAAKRGERSFFQSLTRFRISYLLFVVCCYLYIIYICIYILQAAKGFRPVGEELRLYLDILNLQGKHR